MAEQEEPLHILIFPFMAQGHTIPIIDTAKLLASRHIKVTLLTTNLNSQRISKSIHNHPTIALHAFHFPAAAAGLPDGCEDFDFISSRNLGFDVITKFFSATTMLKDQFEQLVEKSRPDCVIADFFFPWTTASAAKFGVPRLVFRGTSFFSACVSEMVRVHKPHEKACSESEPFLVPGLPDPITLTANQIPAPDKLGSDTFIGRLMEQIAEADKNSYGLVNNTFYELEPAYADLDREIMGNKVWSIGPVSETGGRGNRGNESDEELFFQWLDSNPPRSVVYVCFGSLTNFSDPQLKEIAVGLEASGERFIWVVRREKGSAAGDWLPEGFEERTKGKGVIIRGWAPQAAILNHEAVGGFVTHCGWNSTMEGITAGLPMVTWPVSAEQFYNEKLVTEVLGIGVGVGAKEWTMYGGDMEGGAVAKAVGRLMSPSAAAEEMRRRAGELGKMAKRAVKEGGSSFDNLSDLIEEMKRYRVEAQK